MNISTAELEDKLLENLPINEHHAISVRVISGLLNLEVTENNRNHVHSRISQALKLLVDAKLCERNKSFNVYHYWTSNSMLKKLVPSLLTSKIKERLKKEGYVISRDAEASFLDLLYLFKDYKNTNGDILIACFTEWVIKNSNRTTLGIKSVDGLIYKLRYEINQSSQVKDKIPSKEKVEKVVSDTTLNRGIVQRRGESFRAYILQSLPLTEDQALTGIELASSLSIPHRRKTIISTLSELYLCGDAHRLEKKPYHYWIGAEGTKTKTACISSQEEATSSRIQDIQLLVASIQRAGYNVDPYVYGELATLEAQYRSWQELSDTYIISPNSATFYTYRNNFEPSKDTIAVSKSLTAFLDKLSGMPREDARAILAHLKEGTSKKAIEILRIANDERVMKRIKSGRIPEFVDSVWAIICKGLEVFHPTIITKPTFLQWFIAQLGVNPDITQSNVSAIKNHRLETIIEYDKKAQKLEKKHLPGYPAATSPLIQIDSSSQQDILARIKVVEDDITQIHERYAKIEGIVQGKELSIKLQKLEESKDKEQQKLDLLEEKLRKWNTDDLKVRTGILK